MSLTVRSVSSVAGFELVMLPPLTRAGFRRRSINVIFSSDIFFLLGWYRSDIAARSASKRVTHVRHTVKIQLGIVAGALGTFDLHCGQSSTSTSVSV